MATAPVSPVTLTDAPQTAADAARQAALKARGPIPAHIACIMDGNGRWAKARGMRRVSGHREGVVSVRDVTEACAQLGVQPPHALHVLDGELGAPADRGHRAHGAPRPDAPARGGPAPANGIRLRTLGDLDRLPPRCAAEMREAEALTGRTTGG
jgi:undecaprenyl diphosphate synthase